MFRRSEGTTNCKALDDDEDDEDEDDDEDEYVPIWLDEHRRHHEASLPPW
jgi:hypothetical protein